MPTVTSTDTLRVLRSYLVGQDPPFLRRPGDDAAPTLPPLLLEPDGGPRAPGAASQPVEDHPTLVVTADLDSEPVVDSFDQYRRPMILRFTYLSVGTLGLQLARAVDDRVARALWRDRPDAGYGWQMGTAPASVWVIQAGIMGGLAKVADEEGGRTRQVARYFIDVPSQ